MPPEQVRLLAQAERLLWRTRLASRQKSAYGIPEGKTVDQGRVRIHRYRDHFQVTDLTDAGKRGKRVRVLNVAPSHSYGGKTDQWMRSMSVALEDYTEYDRIVGFFRDILVDYPGEIAMRESVVRGVDVNPGGTVRYDFVTQKGVEVSALPDKFSLKNSVLIRPNRPDQPANDTGKEFYQDTLYWDASKRDAQVFYNWLGANMDEAKRMGMREFQDLWARLGVRYDSH